MQEHEVKNAIDAAFFMANEVVNEYHSFRVVNRADVGDSTCLFIELNGRWFKFQARLVNNGYVRDRLEELA